MRHTFTLGQRQVPKIAVFILPLALLLLADSIMSYLFPIFTEQTLSSNTLMGLVMGFSSLVGFGFDLLAPKLFRKRSWGLMVLLTIAGAILFPITTYLGIRTSHLAWFLIASGVWGMYFEFLFFSAQDFIVSEEPKRFFAKDQGLVSSLWQLTSIVGPIIGGLLFSSTISQFVFVVVTLQVIAFVVYIAFFPREARKELERSKTQTDPPISIIQNILLTKHYIILLLPLFLLGFSNSLITSFFFTVGGLFGKQLANGIIPEWFLLILFSFAGIISTLITPHFPQKTPKHILAMRFLLLGGVTLISFSFLQHPIAVYTATALLGFLLLTSYFFTDLTYEELSRLAGKQELSIFSVSRVATSLAFTFGPILVGYLSDLAGYQVTATIWGILIVCIALTLLRITPKQFTLTPHTD
jgi:predicted MFS family arabinose efflux permease